VDNYPVGKSAEGEEMTPQAKIINIITSFDPDTATTGQISKKLRDHGFKPPIGKNWTAERLIQILEIGT
jgi:hypothetical protein